MGGKPVNKAVVKKYLPKRDDWVRETIDTKDCPVLRRSSVINWDGEVVPCCIDLYSDYPMGNILEEPFSKIWKNWRYAMFRLRNHAGKVAICKNCNTFVRDINVKLKIQ
jgi:radical SAM protein with 4Fe4S-binding SPASM domain